MAGRWDVGFPKTSTSSLREQATRTILRNVRSQGHTYVELREKGKKFIFFCTLCLAPCYSDKVLFDHLKGNLHNDRLAAAKVTLLQSNPWPFNDGMVFFHNSDETDKQLVVPDGNKCKIMESHDNENNLAVVKYGENLISNGNGNFGADGHECNEHSDGANSSVAIPHILFRDEITDIEVKQVGFGQIAARLLEKDELSNCISRIWCEWLGKRTDSNDLLKGPEHDFAVVTFSYNIDLGRKGLLDDVKMLLSSSPTEETENGECSSSKRKKFFSDPEEDISESLSNQFDSCGEDSSASSGATSRLLLERYDDLLHTRFINKSIRRELRRQQRLASGRMCDICQQKMLPGKDVATLINLKTGRLACSSRNVNGAFHVFHTSCLIHWILLCEVEMIMNQSASSKVRRRSRRKTAAKCNGKDDQLIALSSQMNSVFCPECQGTGSLIDNDDLEKPNLPLSQLFKYKIKVSDARRAWMKSPEMLENCSTGFHFPSQSEEGIEVSEKVKPLKLLRFYRAD